MYVDLTGLDWTTLLMGRSISHCKRVFQEARGELLSSLENPVNRPAFCKETVQRIAKEKYCRINVSCRVPEFQAVLGLAAFFSGRDEKEEKRRGH